MNTETELENRNVSPLLYGVIDSKQRESLLGGLEELYNSLGIDTEFNTPDYLLAEYTLNCLVSYGNAVTKTIERDYIKASSQDIKPNTIFDINLISNKMDVGDENEFEKWREEMLKELEKDPNYINPEDELQRFYLDNCEACGSQRCLGVYDEEWREGCKLYKKEFCE